ncbi:MAG TPA: hypothetical protein VNV43_12220 [Candidatus Acidoferrales bacterium]|nr:hypothetical protein [Candidatus Acidoferrales bacterium]
MPTRVACPTCGTDGTSAANDHISRLFPSDKSSSPVIRLIELPQSRAPIATATIPAPAQTSPPPLVPITAVQAPAPAIAMAALPEAAPALAPALPPPTISTQRPSNIRVNVVNPAQRTSRAPAPGRPDPRLGLVDRTQAEHEARAKVMWGDSKEQIVSYLMVQSFSVAEANELVTKLFSERAAAIRSNGIGKIIKGIGCMCVPVIALLYFLSIHYIPTKLFGLTVMVGLWGFYLFVKGVLMAVAPKSERGDVADQ